MENNNQIIKTNSTSFALTQLQSYATLPATSYEDVFAAQDQGMRGIGGMAKEQGEEKVHGVLVLVILGIQDSLNVTNKMSAYQIKEAADLIRHEYYFLTPFDFKVFSDGAKMGKYGASYNRLDVQVLLEWLKKYTEERFEAASYYQNKQHRQLKEAEKLTPEQIEAFKARFYNGADDLFQKIKANDEEPDEAEARFQKWKREEFIPSQVPIEEQIKMKEKELERLKDQAKAVEEFRQSVERGEVK